MQGSYLIDVLHGRINHIGRRVSHALRRIVILIRSRLLITHRVVGLSWELLIVGRKAARVRVASRWEARPHVRKVGLNVNRGLCLDYELGAG